MGQISFNGAEHIDSRDICDRFEELNEAIETLRVDIDGLTTARDTAETESIRAEAIRFLEVANTSLNEWLDENSGEYDLLKKVMEMGEYVDDWSHGVTLIPECCFPDHAEELAKECSDVPRGTWESWPFNCIDWTEAAETLKSDYTVLDIEGETYYVR
jgi:predicted nuclease with TOPRIM domain